MASGRRHSVLIFCLSPIKELYISPIEHYDPDSVFVFIGKGDDILSETERMVYSELKLPCSKVTECNVDTHSYEEILSGIIEIKRNLRERYGDDLDIFINISSGTHEFAAAAMFASMLPAAATAFSVHIDGCGMTVKEIGDLLEKSDINVSEPSKVTGMQNKDPDEEMIDFLSVVNEILAVTKYPKYDIIIDRLKKKGSWSYDPEKKSGSGRTPLAQKEERYLKRHYISQALENGWLEKPSPNTMRITESGKRYLNVYGIEAYDSERILAKECCMYSSMPDEESFDEMMIKKSCVGKAPMKARNRKAAEYERIRLSNTLCDEDIIESDDRKNVMQFEHDGKRYRFTIGME